MIIVDSFERKALQEGNSQLVLFADTKNEVPQTGAATLALIESAIVPTKLPIATILYTASMDIAVLGSDDNWVWKE